MKATIKNALEIENKGGAVLVSEWTTGHGNYISRRPTPQYCAEVPAWQVNTLKGKTKQAALRLLKAHPRAKAFICVINRRALLKEAA